MLQDSSLLLFVAGVLTGVAIVLLVRTARELVAIHRLLRRSRPLSP
jgi:hypothetical protein